MQELVEAREAYDAGCIALHATFQIVMALRTSTDSDAKAGAHEAHALNTNLVMAARKRAGRAASTLENLRAGR
jgi:adenine-specific DNA methylase